MIDFRKFKIGMRTIKTGLAVSISMFIATLLNLKSPIFVGIGAIMAMQSSVSESFNAGVNRMLGTIVGACVGLIFSFIFPQNFIFLGIGIIIVIHIHYIFDWKKSLTLSAIVFLAIFLNSETARITYAINRIIDTFIGVAVAVLINYFVFTPNNKTNLLLSLKQVYNNTKLMVYDFIRGRDVSLIDLKSQMDLIRDSNLKLKEDMDLTSHKTANTELINIILSIMDDIYLEIKYIAKLQKESTISKENLALLRKLSMQIKQDDSDEIKDLDIVYNFHLNNILNNLIKSEDLLEKIMIDLDVSPQNRS
ncbi:FUSC family protein [Paratissierella segnis]|jgi:uncharacterized membrane protein YgaE (UPF0421/DUF939 family)|uniref:FUSC family protein n=1 Tax=Paratissierella segnis TaxID=2763679 RepID=A0A926EZH5_9FIRM|nr:aromatic acid exporter family protein [Paratissierella segnis]MBC8589149.1 FUSC family protein [Paratissierella segnis]